LVSDVTTYEQNLRGFDPASTPAGRDEDRDVYYRAGRISGDSVTKYNVLVAQISRYLRIWPGRRDSVFFASLIFRELLLIFAIGGWSFLNILWTLAETMQNLC